MGVDGVGPLPNPREGESWQGRKLGHSRGDAIVGEECPGGGHWC